jgi:hypothetical protein
MFRFLLPVFLILFIASACCRLAPRQSFDDLKSLEGVWSTTKGVQFNESWKIVNDSLLEGIGFSLDKGDTLFTEQLKIYLSGNQVYYAAMVGSNEKYVHFKLEEASHHTWKFVNSSHDYPNIIQYTMVNDSLLEAKTMNIRGNKEIMFNMKRVKK